MITDGREMTKSHTEADIYKGCVTLMQELMWRFEDYLDFIGVEAGKDCDDEERFFTFFYPTHIVERLFLWNTGHSGGTSQRLKCQELGIDTDDTVIFEDTRGREDEDNG